MNQAACFPGESVAPRVRCGTHYDELAAAYELVYRRYLAKGYVAAPHPGGIVYQATLGLPSSRTLVATPSTGEVVGTLSVVGDNSLGFEAENTFPDEVDTLRQRGLALAEVTCMAIQSDGALKPRSVFFALTKFMIHYAYWRRFDQLLLAIHPRHYRFYWRFFRAYPLGAARPHPFANGNPAMACTIDLHTLKPNVDEALRHRYFSQGSPQEVLMSPPMRPEDHRAFCHRSGIILPSRAVGRDCPRRRVA